MKKIYTILLMLGLITSQNLVFAEGEYQLFCAGVETTEYSQYCKQYFDNVYDWYMTPDQEYHAVNHKFSMNEGLSYEDGVWTYLNWPLQIFYTDQLWQEYLKETEYSDVVLVKELMEIDSDRDLVPDRLQDIIDEAANTLAQQVAVLGFQHPARTQDKYIVIYLEDGGWVEPFMSLGVMGQALVDKDGFPTMYLNPFLRGQALKKTVAHEMFHLIQNSYDPEFLGTYHEELNFSEGTAMWMERQLYEFDRWWYDKDYLAYFDDYYATPNYSLYGINPTNKNFQYGTVLWAIYLESKYSRDIIREVWEGYFTEAARTGNFYSALYRGTDSALKKHGSSLASAYRGFAGWIYDKDQARRGTADYPDIEPLKFDSANYNSDQWHSFESFEEIPGVLGSVFIEFDIDNSVDEFYLNFLGSDEAEWAIDFYSKATGANYKSKVSGIVPIGNSTVKEFRIPQLYLGSKLVAIISPLNAKGLTTDDAPFDYHYPFSINAGFGKSAETGSVNVVLAESDQIFNDITPAHKYVTAITYLKDNNVIDGYPDGAFKPNNTVNRAELMKILIGDSLPSGTYENCFTDVHKEWFASYVCYGKSQGWVEGYANGSFKPAQTVNRAEAIKMAIEVQGLDLPSSVLNDPYSDVPKEQWFAKYVYVAKEAGLFDNLTNYAAGDGMERGNISDIIYRLLAIQALEVEKYEKALDGQME